MTNEIPMGDRKGIYSLESEYRNPSRRLVLYSGCGESKHIQMLSREIVAGKWAIGQTQNRLCWKIHDESGKLNRLLPMTSTDLEIGPKRGNQEEEEMSMRKLITFNNVTLDGYFTDKNGDMSWAHKDSNDAEWSAFIEGNARGEGILVFGRITYAMMASYWPTPLAAQNTPVVAERINGAAKIVFSRTLDMASWNNTRLVKSDLAAEISKLKKEPGMDMVILGSGSLVSQLAHEGLIDEYHLVVHPVVLGKGRTLFEGVKETLSLRLTKTRTFRNGNVLLCYERVG